MAIVQIVLTSPAEGEKRKAVKLSPPVLGIESSPLRHIFGCPFCHGNPNRQQFTTFSMPSHGDSCRFCGSVVTHIVSDNY